ncbi:MAG TPA: ROK family transcriptional regulator [Terriglobia bacterium]|nr:ROK family transcriptional regulator [Terriglobia bacterium]
MKRKQNEDGSNSHGSSGENDVGLGRPALLREVNARRVLRLLRLHGPCSRADLVRYSGLSAPTVSSSVAYLEKKRLVEPLGLGPSGGGRPPGLLRFNAKRGYVVGADIGTSVVRVAIADLNGTVVDKWIGRTRSLSTPKRVVALIRSGIEKLQGLHRIPSPKLLALAAGVPGITDVRKGVVLSAPILTSGWNDIPLRQILEAETGISTAIENDVNLAAIGEGWLGVARGVRDFVFLTIGTGVGAGIFVNGQLYHGSDWAAGEIGYLYVPGTGETPLALRQPGSLESIIGARGIQEAWQKSGVGPANLNHSPGHAPGRAHGHSLGRAPGYHLAATEILTLAESGNTQAQAILRQTARILADAITNVCLILNSSLVVLGGRVGSQPALFDATCRIVERNEFCRPRLALTALGNEAPLDGAICLALKCVERRILPSTVEAAPTLASEDSSGFFQPFLGLAPPN